jgi:hypothetical protein
MDLKKICHPVKIRYEESDVMFKETPVFAQDA